MRRRALNPFVEDDEDFCREACDAASREKLVAGLTRRRAWLFWCAIAATVLLVVSVSFSLASGHSLLLGPLLGVIYFWMKFCECNTSLRMLRLFGALADRTAQST